MNMTLLVFSPKFVIQFPVKDRSPHRMQVHMVVLFNQV